MNDIKVTQVSAATEQIRTGLIRILPQLVGHDVELTLDALTALLNYNGSYLFVATLPNGEVVGTAQLIEYPRPYGASALIEGVVVDEAQRGKGIATLLMDALIAKAKTLSIEYLALTSNPKREAANHVYEKLGFELYETNYRRLKIN